MIVSELNYLEVAHSESQIVGGITNQYIYDRRYFKQGVDICKEISGEANVDGLVAFSEADAYAWGENALSNTLTQAYTGFDRSRSTSTSAAASA